MDAPKGYSTLQVTLHWTIAALVIFQLVVNDAVQIAFDSRMDGSAMVATVMAIVHVSIGLSILGLSCLRLAVRLWRGVPPAPAGNSAIVHWLGSAAHLTLYVFIIGMPISGAIAWFGGSDVSAEIHELARLLLIPLIALHVAGALFEHMILRNDTLTRMLQPEDN